MEKPVELIRNDPLTDSNAPKPDTPEGIAFVQTWEKAASFKNNPEGRSWDCNSIWTTDALAA